MTSNYAITLSQYQILETLLNTTGSASIYSNGTYFSGPMVTPSSLTRSGNYLGTGGAFSSYFQGSIAELLIYSTALSTSDRLNLQGYLSARYHILVPPNISPTTGVYSAAQTVTMTPTPSGNIYYTTDGSQPTGSSTHYTAPITVTSSTPFKAIEIDTYGTTAVAPAYIVIDPQSTYVPTTGLSLWLRSDFGITSSSSQVSQWLDISGVAGLSNDASQSNSSYQPILSSSALNGYPAVTFNGSSQYMQLGPYFTDLQGGASIFTVTSPTGSSGYILDVGNGATSDNVTLSNSSSGTTANFIIDAGSSSSSISASSALTLNKYQLIEALMTPGSSTGPGSISVNSKQVASGTLNNPNFVTRADNHIGTNYNASSQFYQGNLVETLAYNRPLTGAELAQVTAYLIQKYQLHSLAPATPTISIATGTLSGPTEVVISAKAGSTVYVTVDGSTPTTSSPVYIGPINVYYTQTVQAMAVLNGIQSSVASATYTLDSTKWPAPSATDPTVLNLNIQLPTTTAPQ